MPIPRPTTTTAPAAPRNSPHDLDQIGAPVIAMPDSRPLRDLMIREYSISPQDIGSTATNISLVMDGQRQSVSDAVVIYDATYESLRLTEPVFNDLDALIVRLEQSSDLSSDEDALVPEQVAAALRQWFEELASPSPDEFSALADGAAQATTDGLLWVLASGSIVAKRDGQGVLRDIEIVSPEIVSFDGPPATILPLQDRGNRNCNGTGGRHRTGR